MCFKLLFLFCQRRQRRIELLARGCEAQNRSMRFVRFAFVRLHHDLGLFQLFVCQLDGALQGCLVLEKALQGAFAFFALSARCIVLCLDVVVLCKDDAYLQGSDAFLQIEPFFVAADIALQNGVAFF